MSDFDEESRRRPIQQFLEQFRDLDLQNVERWSKSVKVIVCALLSIYDGCGLYGIAQSFAR